MHSQVCPCCKKEFMPRKDNRPHTFCCRKCALDHEDERARVNKQFRKENNLPPKNTVS